MRAKGTKNRIFPLKENLLRPGVLIRLIKNSNPPLTGDDWEEIDTRF